MAPKTLEGYVGSGVGAPLDAIAATVRKVADGAIVTTGATGPDGRWRFSGLPPGDEYFVTLADGAGRAVVRGPWSGELREVWVRDRLDLPATATAVLPGRASVYLDTLPLGPVDLTDGAGALDYRYVNTAGDTMTGALVVPALTVGGNDLSQAALDARYVNTAGDSMTGALTVPGLSVAGNDISLPTLDARYVNATGDAMTGPLTLPTLTVGGNAISYAALDSRYVNTAGDAMTGALSIGGLAVATSPDAGNGLEWRANGFFATAGGGGPSGTNTAAWVTRVANQTVANATDTAVSFDTEVRDDGSYWTSGSPTRITIPTTGWYGFAGWIIWEANTLGIRFLHLRKNATDFVATTSSGPHATDGNARLTVAMNLYLVAGDYIEMLVYHNRGASTTLTVAGALSVVGLGAAATAGAPTTAPYITTAPDAGLSNEVLLASVIGYGTNAAMPAAAIAGRLYYDTTNSLLMRDSGTTWQSVEGAGGGGGLTKAQADTYYEPLDSAYTKAESDARYEPLDSAYTKAEDDARFLQLTGGSVMTGLLGPTTTNTRDLGTTALRWRKLWAVDADLTNAPTVGGSALLTTAAGDARYEPIDTMYTKAESDARYLSPATAATTYVDVAGDTMTGDLNMTANVLPTVTNVRDLGSTTLRWRKVWATDADFTNAPTVGGAALLTATTADALFLTPAEGNAAYATVAHNHDATYVQLTGGSVMTGLLGPTTTNSRDLGTTALRWRALYGMTADLSTSLTVASKAVGVSATGGNVLTWNADGFYVAAGAVTDIWVNTTGDTMTGTLNMTADILPTTTDSRDLGSTSLRFRKLWATDADFTNAPTVGGSALQTQAAADTRYVNTSGDTMTGALAISLASGAAAITLRGGNASDTTQLRFRGNASAVDQWAIGNMIASNGTGRSFEIYDLVSAATRMLLDSAGNLGLGTTPPAWGTDFRALQLGPSAALAAYLPGTLLSLRSNSYADGTNDRAIVAGPGLAMNLGTGAFAIYNTPSLAAGDVQTWTQRLFLNSAGTGLVVGAAAMPAVASAQRAIMLGQTGLVQAHSAAEAMNLSSNNYYDGTNNRAIATGPGSSLQQGSGGFNFYTFPSVAAGAVQTYTLAMSLAANGTLSLAGPLMQSGGYAYIGGYNAGGPIYPRVGIDLAVAYNFSGGFRDITLWNTDANNTVAAANSSFVFRQLLSASTRTDLMTIRSNGFTSIYGTLENRSDATTVAMWATRNPAGVTIMGTWWNGALVVYEGNVRGSGGATTTNVYGSAPQGTNRRLQVVNDTGGTLGWIPLYA